MWRGSSPESASTRAAGNTGTHVGHLWTSTGTLLASATFTSETATGWQQVSFATPVAISANTAYVASYTDPVGRYSLNRPYFTSAYDNPPLHALADGDGGPNGVYKDGTGFPTESFQASNYWVDVVFATSAVDTTPPTVAGVDSGERRVERQPGDERERDLQRGDLGGERDGDELRPA